MNKFAWLEALRGVDLTHAEYRVAVNLSTWANGDLTNAYPGKEALAEAAGVSMPTLKKALRSLTEKGWVVLVERGGNQYWKGKANVYSLTVPKGANGLPPSSSQGGKPFSQGGSSVSEGGKSAPGEGGKPVAPHQVIEPSPSINAFHQGAAPVALGDAGAREEGEEPPPETYIELAEALGLDLAFDRGATAPVVSAPVEVCPVAEIAPDPLMNPLAWLDNSLPTGFLCGERAKARELLDAGTHYTSVRWEILRGRQKSRPKLPSSRRRVFIDDSNTA
ncbi:GntR family transcriptional regulator [Nocardia transvalensis]|uniref:GntR family transcriptional regulator n=1 Tax=Nocardia transvalensis TaxID=37333 RepID=UPI00189380FB|nr:GntR family transcriptional regulator [Nocardia transvalensis]MBF6328511.1 GntR family transcriptional regulator [Nocardia transvalensis]